MVKSVAFAASMVYACVPTGGELVDPAPGAHAAIEDVDTSFDHRRVSRLMMESHTISDITRSQVVADVYDEYPAPVSEAVSWEESCRITHRRVRAESFERESYNLGPLRVLGGSREVTLTAGDQPGDTGYPTYSSDSSLFLGGETLNVSVLRAGTVGRHVDLVAPHAVVMNEPLYPPDNMLMVDRYHDLDIAWSGSSAGELVVQLSAITEPGVASVEVECFFPAEDGQGRISLWTFQEIPEDAAMKLTAEVRSTEILEVPSWGELEVRASTRALVPSGAMYAASMGFWPFPHR